MPAGDGKFFTVALGKRDQFLGTSVSMDSLGSVRYVDFVTEAHCARKKMPVERWRFYTEKGVCYNGFWRKLQD